MTMNLLYVEIAGLIKYLIEMPLLVQLYENTTRRGLDIICEDPYTGCSVWFESHYNLLSTLSVIGNVSSSTGILIEQGLNDSHTPPQQAFLLQQRLTEVDHSDHTLIAYPDLGHLFYPSSQWIIGRGPFPDYFLADLYSWLEAHSGLAKP
jgi:hypothetical protein